MSDLYSDDEAYAIANDHYLKGKEILLRHQNDNFAKDALAEFEAAADMGHVRAMYYAGAIHDNPMLDAKCPDAEGYEWLIMAAEQGDCDAASMLHDHYYRGLYDIDSETMDFEILRILAMYEYSDARRDIQCYLKHGVDGWYQNGELAEDYPELRT